MKDNPIGIFDSGIGGLTVAKEIGRQLPNESIIYLGDTARVPYGTRSKEVVTKFALELVGFLLKRSVKCLVIACNTISALALETIEKISPVPVVEVVKPAVRQAVALSKNGRIGVIGTQGTIASGAYEIEIRKLKPKSEIISCSCRLFVPIAEEGLTHHKATKLIVKDYLADVMKANVDTLILGCTHYPLLMEPIKETLGEGVVLVDSAEPTTRELKDLLKQKRLLSSNPNPKYEFYVTDAPVRVYQVAGRFFGKALDGNIKQVTLPTL